MRPGKYDMEVYHGDTFSWQFVCWQDDAKTQPSDLSDVEAAAQVRKSYGDDTLTMQLTCTITDNVVTVDLTPEIWKVWSLKQKSGVWDLQLTYASGAVVTIVAGSVTIDPDVTDGT